MTGLNVSGWIRKRDKASRMPMISPGSRCGRWFHLFRSGALERGHI